jgi:hypothetical protein
MKSSVFVIFYFLIYSSVFSQENIYTTKILVEKMQQAHGGLQNWKKAKTVYFNHHIVFGTDSTRQWWISREMTELSTMRFYETRPYENATIVYDGNKTWSTNWKQTNPPSMLVNNHLLQQVLPFLASHPMVVISKEPDVKLPANDSVSFLTLKLKFKQEANFDSAKYYRIFIHPVSFRMAGWEYNITHPKQLKNIGLADSIKSFGPFINKIHTYTTVDGLLFPEKYDTYNPSGKISGNHLVLDYKINGKFDEKRMEMPFSAITDLSLPIYKFKLNK